MSILTCDNMTEFDETLDDLSQKWSEAMVTLF